MCETMSNQDEMRNWRNLENVQAIYFIVIFLDALDE